MSNIDQIEESSTMSEIFKLSIENGLRPWKYFQRSEAIDITPIDEAITNFTIKYAFTKWFISIGHTTVTLFLRELDYLWFFGEALASLQVVAQGQMSNLTLVEQGVNKQLSIRPIANSHVEIEMIDYHGFESGYTTMLISPTQIDLAQFLNEWVRFFESIFDLMIRDCLITSQDESLQAYRKQLRALV